MKYIFLAITLLLIFIGCSKNQQNINLNSQEESIKNSLEIKSYELGTNFFVRTDNKIGNLKKPYIDNQLEFEAIFGKAKTLETIINIQEIDFSKNIVIPIILEETKISKTIEVNKIYLNGNVLNINYIVTEMQPLTYVIQPSEVIIIDRKRLGNFKNLKYQFEKTTIVL